MKEVAERTGVSVSTVSLVLNDRDEGRVKPAIAEQVRATAKRLGYRPNPLARSLRTSKTRILGFISEEIAATPHAGGIILGAQDAASKLGYMLLTVNTDGNSDEAREIATLKRYGVDGFLYAKLSNRFTDVPKPLHDYPLVLVDATDRTGRYASIEPDETLIGYDATKRLIDACCADARAAGTARGVSPCTVGGGHAVRRVAGGRRAEQRACVADRDRPVRAEAARRVLLLQ